MPGWYNRATWLRERKRVLHRDNYTCTRCGCSLVGKGRGAHVHHRKTLKHAPALQLEPLNLVALCRCCHSQAHQDEQHQDGADINGNPLDPNHPWNAQKGPLKNGGGMNE